MCEVVKRNNGGNALAGQFFAVGDDLIAMTQEMLPGWAQKTTRQIAQMIVNGTPTFDLARPQEQGTETRTIFHLPGGAKVTLPIRIVDAEPNPRLFLNERKMRGI